MMIQPGTLRFFDGEVPMFKIQPVILCGGSGTRLWPASRARYPKQFMLLGNGDTLFAETLRRTECLEGTGSPIIVSNDA